MGRFHAASAADRRALFADAIAEHEERSGSFVTVVAAVEGDEEAEPWIQYRSRTLHLDCTEEEFERLAEDVAERGDVTIVETTRPVTAEGVNVRLTADGGPDRVAECIERWFRDVFDRPCDYRAWVVHM